MNIKIFILSVSLFASLDTFAHDFSVLVKGQNLFFEITNKSKKTVSVTYEGQITEKKFSNVTGTIEIPAKIKHNNLEYEVSAITPKAFAYAKHLKGLVIPSSIKKIGDFAFEGCDSLTSIIFPGSMLALGQGVFFKCPMIEHVTIGSDWNSVDFTMFRWSDRLLSVNIPAKVEKIQGIKKLVGLKSITVDANNRVFSSINNLLYSKDGSILYACPRALKGKLVIMEGTTDVHPGALIDCVGISVLDCPSTLQRISFRETSRMKNLETIIMRSSTPITTAYTNGMGKFLFQIVSPDIQIVVPSKAKDGYVSAMATKAGEYSEDKTSQVAYIVSEMNIPLKKRIKGVKNFDKH